MQIYCPLAPHSLLLNPNYMHIRTLDFCVLWFVYIWLEGGYGVRGIKEELNEFVFSWCVCMCMSVRAANSIYLKAEKHLLAIMTLNENDHFAQFIQV